MNLLDRWWADGHETGNLEPDQLVDGLWGPTERQQCLMVVVVAKCKSNRNLFSDEAPNQPVSQPLPWPNKRLLSFRDVDETVLTFPGGHATHEKRQRIPVQPRRIVYIWGL